MLLFYHIFKGVPSTSRADGVSGVAAGGVLADIG